ncbi:hypothetical protein JCM24511_02095 [Saitozyma sp. JCM 24511]|nr:hypothetical protein JCM24511_02095 [Saitozyma sp. JCM 24511]
MPQYGSDCDRYQRLRLAGYSTIDCVDPIAPVIHVHALLTHDERRILWDSGLSLEDQVSFLERINCDKDQYAWRNSTPEIEGEVVAEEEDWHDGLQPFDRAAAAAEGDGGRQYFEAKWGPFDCELGDRTPRFDIAAVR